MYARHSSKPFSLDQIVLPQGHLHLNLFDKSIKKPGMSPNPAAANLL
jgi:hypothetical protein